MKEILHKKQNKLIQQIQRLFPGKLLNFAKKPIHFPCPFQNCTFEGTKLKRHLQASAHKFSDTKAKTYETFLKQQLNFLTFIDTHKQSKPQMCYQFKSFFERVDSHYLNFHQRKRQSTKMKKALEKSKVMTEDFVRRYFLWAGKHTVSGSNNEQSTSTSTSNTTSTSSTSTSTSNTQKRPETSKQKNVDETTQKKLPKSSSGEIRLRGVFQKPSPGSQRQMICMPNKLPLTKALHDKYNIPERDNFKFHYESAELLLVDYKSYILNSLKRLEISAAQYLLDINNVWSTVDPNLSLNLNQLQHPQNIETRFFLPTRQKLIENKDKDHNQQTDHIQAKTIKGKLQNLVRLTDFFER